MRRVVCALLLFALALSHAGCASRSEPLSAKAFQSVIEIFCAPEMQGRDAGTKGLELARDEMVSRFKALGLQPAFVIDGKPSYTQPFTLRIGRDAEGEPIEATVYNVGGLLPGSGSLAEQVVVVGAHYDHVGYGNIGSRAKDQRGTIHPGADDNASGTAGVLLLAEHAVTSRISTRVDRRAIMFTGFAGEERGLHGSRYMTRNPEQWAFKKDYVAGMINMDMIGRLRNNELYVFTDATGDRWRQWINDANATVGLDLQWDVRPPGGSDHSLFIAIGIPSIFLNTWLHDDYHTPRDTPDKINARGGAKILALVANLLNQTATSQDRLTFVPPKPRPPHPFLGAMLGEHERGTLVQSLSEKGPLEKAGFKEGDILLTIADRPARTSGQVRNYLARAQPGDEVAVVFLRDGEQMTLTVRLGVRR